MPKDIFAIEKTKILSTPSKKGGEELKFPWQEGDFGT
jgi:hypothetical protein